MVGSRSFQAWGNLGAQVNVAFRLWSNLDSTLSLGMARAWDGERSFDEWFVSVKVLR